MNPILAILAYLATGMLLGVLDTLVHGKRSMAATTKYKAIVAWAYMCFWPLMVCVLLGATICQAGGWVLNAILKARN